MLRFIFKTVLFVFLTSLGAALAGKFALKSHAGADTQEIDLVNLLGGENVISHADPFYGGKITNAFGGLVLDLRKAVPSPTGIHLDVLIWMGGVDLVVPSGWRVVFEGVVFAGGFADLTETTADPDAPIVRISGWILFGGLRAATRPAVETVTA